PVPADAGTLSEFVCSGIECGDAFALPLVSDGLPLGAVLVAMPATLPFLIDVELVATVADLAAAAVASERVLLHSRTEARRDGLAGLLTRRAFDERLDRLGGRRGLACGRSLEGSPPRARGRRPVRGQAWRQEPRCHATRDWRPSARRRGGHARARGRRRRRPAHAAPHHAGGDRALCGR